MTKVWQGLRGSHLFRKKAAQICAEYPRQARVIKKQLRQLAVYEEQGLMDVDMVAGAFGALMEELFVIRKDFWERIFADSDFILENLSISWMPMMICPKDRESGVYNPLKLTRENCKSERRI